jgi:hypothetical protein
MPSHPAVFPMLIMVFCALLRSNVVHGSDSTDSSSRELALWFPEGLVVGYGRCCCRWFFSYLVHPWRNACVVFANRTSDSHCRTTSPCS